MPGQELKSSCGATLLSALHSLNAYYHTLTLFTECLLRLAYSLNFPLALKRPFGLVRFTAIPPSAVLFASV